MLSDSGKATLKNKFVSAGMRFGWLLQKIDLLVVGNC
jgi:hypothetical protein